MARFRPMLRQHGVSEQQWRILRALDSDGPMRASDLAADTLLSLPSLTRLVKTLSDRRLIRRDPSAEDQRSVVLDGCETRDGPLDVGNGGDPGSEPAAGEACARGQHESQAHAEKGFHDEP